MPYNTTAIPPRKEATGQAQLPLARVKKIIALDADIFTCSTHAAFVMTVAAEMFIQFLAEQGNRVAKSEKKPRKNIQYADISNAVHRLRQTEFLLDVVPRTVPYKRIVERKAKEEKEKAAAAQRALENGGLGLVNGAAADERARAVSSEDAGAQLQREDEMQAATANGHHDEAGDADVEMGDE